MPENFDWINTGTLLSAAGAAFLSLLARYFKSEEKLKTVTPESFGEDLWRGMSAFPLAILVLAPVLTSMGVWDQKQLTALLDNNSALLAVASLSGLVGICANWWKNI